MRNADGSMPKPKQISTQNFMGSVFQNSECETILRNIVMLQQDANPEEWTSFSWDDYTAFCTHRVASIEKDVLLTFVFGGKPVWNTTAIISGGWLGYAGEKFSFTGKMIDMLSERYPA